MTYLPSMTPKYIPDLTVPWTDTEYTHANPPCRIFRIGSTLYMFGGAGSNKIYSTALNNPTGWADTGSTISITPTTSLYMAIIGDYIYIFGGSAGETQIHKAPLSNPLSWSDTGSTIGTIRNNTNIFVLPECNRIVMPEGHNEVSGNQNVGYASIDNPTVWANSSAVSYAGWEVASGSLNGAVYCLGGVNANYALRRYSAADGVTQTYYTTGIPAASQIPSCWHLENSLFTIGFNPGTNIIQYIFDASGHYITNATIGNIPVSASYVGLRGDWIDPSTGYLYTFTATSNKLYRSGRKLVYSEPQVPGSSRPLVAVNQNGSITTVTSSCLLGYRSWLTNRYDLAL
jgi:hypothetical protein